MTGAAERVLHDPGRRFTIALDHGVAVLEYRALDGGTTLDYYHTFVPPALRGRGIASELTAFALRYALDRHLKVVPTCPFVAAYISRHREFESALAG
jgi:predicted GNAT family acetyltransferase